MEQEFKQIMTDLNIGVKTKQNSYFFWRDFVTLLDFGVCWKGQLQGVGLELGFDNI